MGTASYRNSLGRTVESSINLGSPITINTGKTASYTISVKLFGLFDVKDIVVEVKKEKNDKNDKEEIIMNEINKEVGKLAEKDFLDSCYLYINQFSDNKWFAESFSPYSLPQVEHTAFATHVASPPEQATASVA